MNRHTAAQQFAVLNGEVAIGGVPVSTLTERVGGTPYYAYDRSLLTARVRLLREALPPEISLHYAIKANPKAQLSVDLAKTELTLPDGSKVKFPVDNFAQHCLLNGIDQLGYILSFDEKIKGFEAGI